MSNRESFKDLINVRKLDTEVDLELVLDKFNNCQFTPANFKIKESTENFSIDLEFPVFNSVFTIIPSKGKFQNVFPPDSGFISEEFEVFYFYENDKDLYLFWWISIWRTKFFKC